MAVRAAAPLLQWNLGSPVRSVAPALNGIRLATGSDDAIVRVWDMRTGPLIHRPLLGHTGAVRYVAWSFDSSRIVSGSTDASICIWDACTGDLIVEPLRGHDKTVHSVGFSHDGTRVVSGSGDHTIRIWNARTGASIGEPLKGHEDTVYSVAFSPDSTRIVSGSRDKTVCVWDPRTGDLVGSPLRGHTDSVLSVMFTSDNAYIISGSDDHTIRMWDALTGASVRQPLKGHTDWVNSVALSPDAVLIVSGSSDMTIRIWDICSGAPIGEPLTGPTARICSVAFSADSSRVVSGWDDGSICVWDAQEIAHPSDPETGNMSPLSFENAWSKLNTPRFEMVTKKMSGQDMFDCLVEHGCADLTLFADASRSSAVITSGGFGDVRRMVMRDDTIVAVKTLRLHILLKDNEKALKRAVREVYIWSKLHDVNVQRLLGIIHFQGGIGMVSPWMEQGNLMQYLTAHPTVRRYPLCAQLTSGVVYLHGIQMVHGDLKAINVLVSQDGTLKINDFDYAILATGTLQFSTTTRPGGGTLRWMAPELLRPDDDDDDEEHGNKEENHLVDARTTRTDVYALGMTMLEIFTGTIPYAEYNTDMKVYRALHFKKPPKRPKVLSGFDDSTLQIWKLLLRCWDHDPLARPDASMVLAVVKEIEYLNNI